MPYIDWSPFFSAWELTGRHPQIFDDPLIGAEAKKLHADAQTLLAKIAAEKLFTPRATIAFWPCNSDGDDIEIYNSTDFPPVSGEALSASAPLLARLHHLRQQHEKPAGQRNHSLAD
ncbi:MAG: methionine synthase, partial [Opitutaceae bacterium]|nr:methionine synthase [Opitutaceae bacterium]